jgi:hypothetical protein
MNPDTLRLIRGPFGLMVVPSPMPPSASLRPGTFR